MFYIVLFQLQNSNVNTLSLIGGADKQHMSLHIPQNVINSSKSNRLALKIYYKLPNTLFKDKKYASVIVWECISTSYSSAVFSYKGLFTAWLPLFLSLAGSTLADNWFTPPTFLVVSLLLAATLAIIAANITAPQHVPGSCFALCTL